MVQQFKEYDSYFVHLQASLEFLLTKYIKNHVLMYIYIYIEREREREGERERERESLNCLP